MDTATPDTRDSLTATGLRTQPAGSPAGRGSVLRLRDFRWLFIGQSVSHVGDQIFPVAMAVRVLETGGTAGDLGLVLGARFLALVLLVLVGGVWADRLPRRTVMITSDLARAAAVIGLALTPDGIPVLALAALTFAVGAGEAFFQPAYGALVPDLVPPDRLVAAQAATGVSLRAAAVLGPAVGGLLVASGGLHVAFGLDAATFLVSAATLAVVRERPHAARATRSGASMLAEIREGLAVVRSLPWVAAILAFASVSLMLCVAPMTVLLPLVARERLGGNAAYGLVLSCFSVGAVVGALLTPHWHPVRRGRTALLVLCLYATAPVALLLPTGLPVVAGAYALGGLGIAPFNAWWEASLAVAVPREVLARVVSVDWMCSYSLMPLGLALTGPAIGLVGRETVLIVAAVMAVLPNVLVLAVPGVSTFGRLKSAT